MPRKAVTEGPGKRVALNMKTTEQVRGLLEEAAAESGRSLTQEVEWRIGMSFEWERAFGDIQKMRAEAKDATEGGADAILRRAKYIPAQTSKGRAYFENVDVLIAYTRPSIEAVKQGVAEALQESGLAPAKAEEHSK